MKKKPYSMPGIVCNQQANFPSGCTWREQNMTNELRDLIAFGCSPMQALQAATG